MPSGEYKLRGCSIVLLTSKERAVIAVLAVSAHSVEKDDAMKCRLRGLLKSITRTTLEDDDVRELVNTIVFEAHDYVEPTPITVLPEATANRLGILLDNNQSMCKTIQDLANKLQTDMEIRGLSETKADYVSLANAIHDSVQCFLEGEEYDELVHDFIIHVRTGRYRLPFNATSCSELQQIVLNQLKEEGLYEELKRNIRHI